MPTPAGLWQRTLAPSKTDIHASARERLRASYEACRTSAALIAAEISRDLPDYTIHDVTHMDALWELADLIAGSEYDLSPLEAYVLGCAMLIHDLAMARAAYPSDFSSLVGNERWRDTLHFHLQQEIGRPPTAAEITNAQEHTIQAAKRDLLRELHAAQAARLPHERFQDRERDTEYYLIADPDLRNMFGDVIGRIAASHWWEIAQLSDEFDSRLGAPAAFPNEWTVDPLKLACLLRVADASHLDSRRAPGFLRAIRRVDDESRIHWIFQERLNRPWLDVDRLTYTAQQPFTAADSDAWWLCVDTLRVVDRELRTVDSLLADTARPRFAARSVAYVDDLKRLARLIPVRDWYPLDARVRVSDVIDLVRKIGGRQLYGNDYQAPVRELISNGADAVRARRSLEGSRVEEELRLRVQVEVRKEEGHTWFVVRDNGIGMSREVMSGPLLDFGKSFWQSSSARREFPGLISSGFRPTGQFGIGFFSVFMLGNQVRVASRRFDLGNSDTNVLVFQRGLGSRPLLRRGNPGESLPFGGTEVAVKLDSEATANLLDDHGFNLKEFCSRLCPTADFNLDVVLDNGDVEQIITANDWATCPADVLLDRLDIDYANSDPTLPERLRMLAGKNGEHLGRAAITTDSARLPRINRGVVTADGMRTATQLSSICGVLLGNIERATRDVARPIVGRRTLARWASEQAQIIETYEMEANRQLSLVRVVRALGGDPGNLLVAQANCGYLRSSDVREWATRFDVLYLYHDAAFSIKGILQEYLKPNVLVVGMGVPAIVQQGAISWEGRRRITYNDLEHLYINLDNSMDRWCIEKVSESWNVPFAYLAQQRQDAIDASNKFSKTHDPNLHPEDDPSYPYRKKVAESVDGQPIFGSVTILKRMP